MTSFRERWRALPLWPMLAKEFIQMRRDRLTLAMMVVLPAIQLALFGFAIRTEVRHIPTAIIDASRTQQSRALLQVLANTGNFDIVADATTGGRPQAEALLLEGRVHAVMVIPPDFARDIKRGRTATAQVIVDAADPMASSAAISGASLAAAAYGTTLVFERMPNIHPPLDVRVRPRFNPALRSQTYIVPGIIGVLLSLTMILITSMAIVRERERGTLEQLVVTPIDKTSLMLGKVLPFVLVGYVQMTIVLLLGRVMFDVPIRGSVVLLYLITATFIVANLGIGLFVSTLANTQVQAMQMSFFLLMPNILLSGFMFPREAMPALAQWLGAVLPLTYYLEVLRGILLKGVGMTYLWKETLVLAVIAVAVVTLSVQRFSKTLE